ncbi:MAG: type II toxin-antitoxin system HicB family antitoxin [bacterium]
MLTYTVELKPQKEGGYTVTAPALPGCISEGDTMEEALENIKDAIDGYIKVLVKRQKKVPLEFSVFKDLHTRLQHMAETPAS